MLCGLQRILKGTAYVNMTASVNEVQIKEIYYQKDDSKYRKKSR